MLQCPLTGAIPFGAGLPYHTARGLRVTQAVLLFAAGGAGTTSQTRKGMGTAAKRARSLQPSPSEWSEGRICRGGELPGSGGAATPHAVALGLRQVRQDRWHGALRAPATPLAVLGEIPGVESTPFVDVGDLQCRGHPLARPLGPCVVRRDKILYIILYYTGKPPHASRNQIF